MEMDPLRQFRQRAGVGLRTAGEELPHIIAVGELQRAGQLPVNGVVHNDIQYRAALVHHSVQLLSHPSGIVLDGPIRDIDEIGNWDFPVYCTGTTPGGPYKEGPGEINVPVVIGGKLVRPGDIVVGDDDGVLFIDPAIAAELADATEAVEKKEADIMAHILGDGTYIRPWVDEKLKEISCEIL